MFIFGFFFSIFVLGRGYGRVGGEILFVFGYFRLWGVGLYFVLVIFGFIFDGLEREGKGGSWDFVWDFGCGIEFGKGVGVIRG